MNIHYAYQRPRATMGQPLHLERFDPEIIASIPPNQYDAMAHTTVPYKDTEIQNVCTLSEHSTNTERIQLVSTGMLHEEGGWPRDVDPTEVEHIARYKRKQEKEESFLVAVRALSQRLAPIVKQNNAIDIYPRFFHPSPHMPIPETREINEEEEDLGADLMLGDHHGVMADESPAAAASPSTKQDPRMSGQGHSGAHHDPHQDLDGGASNDDMPDGDGNDHQYGWLRTVGCLQDPIFDLAKTPTLIPRAATSTSWNVSESHRSKVAISFTHTHPGYSANVTQLQAYEEPVASYIFDIHAPNEPDFTLTPHSPLSTLSFSMREVNMVGGGCVDGSIVLFDTRRSGEPVIVSRAEGTGVVSSFNWLQVTTKSMEVFSTTNSPVTHIWDLRRPTEPIDTLRVVVRGQNSSKVHCAVASDYCTSSVGPGKMLVGTDTGIIVEMSRRGRTDSDRVHMVHGSHHGPVVAVQKHPIIARLVLSAGDWSLMVWHDEMRLPLYAIKARPACIADAVWHPQHPSVLFIALENGMVEMWNLLRSHTSPQSSVMVGNGAGIHSLRHNFDGSILSVGLKKGGVVLLKLHSSAIDSLLPPLQAKAAMHTAIDRELSRQKLLAADGNDRVFGRAAHILAPPDSTRARAAELASSGGNVWAADEPLPVRGVSIVDNNPASLDQVLADVASRMAAPQSDDSSSDDGNTSTPESTTPARPAVVTPPPAAAPRGGPTPPKAPRSARQTLGGRVAAFRQTPTAADGAMGDD